MIIPGKRPKLIGTDLDGTIVAILENHQQKDGSVKIPKALIPFLGMDSLVPA